MFCFCEYLHPLPIITFLSGEWYRTYILWENCGSASVLTLCFGGCWHSYEDCICNGRVSVLPLATVPTRQWARVWFLISYICYAHFYHKFWTYWRFLTIFSAVCILPDLIQGISISLRILAIALHRNIVVIKHMNIKCEMIMVPLSNWLIIDYWFHNTT